MFCSNWSSYPYPNPFSWYYQQLLSLCHHNFKFPYQLFPNQLPKLWKNFIKLTLANGQLFQIKASGASVDNNPTLTFTLRKNNGLEIDFNADHHGTSQYIPMLNLAAAKGKWIQVGSDLLKPSISLDQYLLQHGFISTRKKVFKKLKAHTNAISSSQHCPTCYWYQILGMIKI